MNQGIKATPVHVVGRRRGQRKGVPDRSSYFTRWLPTCIDSTSIRPHAALLVGFCATMILTALLLFSIRPLFARMVLPLLGGVPLVWNGTTFFYQGILLLGYGYVYLASRWMNLRTQSIVQMVLLGLGALALPVAIAQGRVPGATDGPRTWLPGTMVVSLGVPLFGSRRPPRSCNAGSRSRPAPTPRTPVSSAPEATSGASSRCSRIPS